MVKYSFSKIWQRNKLKPPGAAAEFFSDIEEIEGGISTTKPWKLESRRLKPVQKVMIVNDSFSCDARSSTVLLAYYMTFNSIIIIIIINYFNYHYVRRRRTHTNRVALRESLSRVFMDQPKGERSWCHAISGIGRHFGLADSWAGWLAGYVAQIASISCATVKGAN